MAESRKILRELLVKSYSQDELKTLATDIAGVAELVFSDGGTLETWARELVEWCARRNKIENLITSIKETRPDIYKDYEKKLKKSLEKPLIEEVRTASRDIEEMYGVLREEGSIKKKIHPKAKRARRLRVFLCHSSQDKPIVREFYQRLSAEDWIDPWLDEEKLLPGMDWNMEIEKAVETADAVLVFLSNNSVTKEGYVQRELKYVLDIALEKPEGTIFIIPVRLEDCKPPRQLRSLHCEDVFPLSQKDRAIQRIISS